MSPHFSATRVVTWALAGFLLGLGIVMLGLGRLSYQETQGLLLGMGAGDVMRHVTPAFQQAMAAKLRIAGSLACLLAGLVFWLRGWLANQLAVLRDSFSRLFGDMALHFRRLARETPSAHWLVFGLIISAAAGLRLYHLFQPMRYDEAHTFVFYASRPLAVVVSAFFDDNNHILHSMLVHFSTLLLGEAEWAVRLPAFVAGLLIVPALYLLITRFYGAGAGLWAAAAAAVWPGLIEYSVNARGYTLVALLFLILFRLAIYLRKRPEPAGWALWALLAALGLYTIRVMAYPLAVILAWWLLSPRPGPGGYLRRIQWPALVKALAAAAVITVILYSPVIMVNGLGHLNPSSLTYPTQSLLSGFMENLLRLLRECVRDLPEGIGWIAAGGLALCARDHYTSQHELAFPALAMAVAFLAPTLVLRKLAPQRVWLFDEALFAGLSAAGWSWAAGKAAKALPRMPIPHFGPLLLTLAMGAWVVTSGVVFADEETGTLRDGKNIAAYILSHYQKGDGVLAEVPAHAPLRYYLRQGGLTDQKIFWFHLLRNDQRVWIVEKDRQAEDLATLIKRHKLDQGFSYPLQAARFGESRLFLVKRQTMAESGHAPPAGLNGQSH
ncbi:hypothetical protein AAU61_00925 [Desulfocarbo indianensis]|nr:hypothetical protein AAU61_00925 [Desulfocarbo indianensis]